MSATSLTPQMAYELVRDGMEQHGARSNDGNGKCLFLGPNKRRCAVGMLIPLDYEPLATITEDFSVQELVGHLKSTDVYSIAATDHHEIIRMMSRLQGVHDSSVNDTNGEDAPFMATWRRKLKDFRERWNRDHSVVLKEVG